MVAELRKRHDGGGLLGVGHVEDSLGAVLGVRLRPLDCGRRVEGGVRVKLEVEPVDEPQRGHFDVDEIDGAVVALGVGRRHADERQDALGAARRDGVIGHAHEGGHEDDRCKYDGDDRDDFPPSSAPLSGRGLLAEDRQVVFSEVSRPGRRFGGL